jgi:hypothetical protein
MVSRVCQELGTANRSEKEWEEDGTKGARGEFRQRRKTINKKTTSNSEPLRPLMDEKKVIFPSSRRAYCTFRKSCAPWQLLCSMNADTPFLERSLCRNNC